MVKKAILLSSSSCAFICHITLTFSFLLCVVDFYFIVIFLKRNIVWQKGHSKHSHSHIISDAVTSHLLLSCAENLNYDKEF